jgi:cell division septation protein DedD
VNSRRQSVRDYKRTPREALPLAGTALRPFSLGLLVGLAVAATVFISDHRSHAGGMAQIPPLAASRATTAAGTTADSAVAGSHGAGSTSSGAPPSAVGAQSAQSTGLAKYDFYQMLPRSQVLIPGRESDTRPTAGGQIDRPGVYFLQIGSYRDAAVAERMRAQALKLGVMATVQLIVVNTTAWHRVRVGPIRDLTLLNRTRRQLLAGNLEALTVRVNP